MTDPTFLAARQAWDDLAPFRATRRRLKDYTYGRQWGDPVRLPDGSWTTEGALAEADGARPMTNNLLRQIVKTIVGRFRERCHETDTQDRHLAAAARRNNLDELDARMLEEFLISGAAVQRVVRERRPAGRAVWVDNVPPWRMFFNAHTDPRGHDLTLIGMLHDVTLADLLMRFGGDDAAEHARLRTLWRNNVPVPSLVTDTQCFDRPATRGMCRLIEVWTLDADAEADAEPLRWQCRWYAPDGTLIALRQAPSATRTHPFAIKLYPLIDSEIHPFVEDIVDQQRHINRLITLIDHIMSTSAKGTLLFPVDALTEGWSLENVADTWAHPGGIVLYDARKGHKPELVTAGSANAGASQLLDLELRLIEQVSGVNHAVQGRDGVSANTSATLYNAQLSSALTALRDIFDTFDNFRSRRSTLITLLS